MNLRYILSRILLLVVLGVLAWYGYGYVKNYQRQSAIVSELKSLSSESSFFRQFTYADARKSLVRATGLIAEARKLGLEPATTIDRALGIEKKYFASDDDRDPTSREELIRSTLRSNYENFRKLGYTPDQPTLKSFRTGELPPIPSGALKGGSAEVGAIISPALSPGLETVLANLEIRPVRDRKIPPTDVEAALARRLATDLERAGVIETAAAERIRQKLGN